MLIELAESYIQSINTGKLPTINTAWQNVQKTELERAYQAGLNVFNQHKTNITKQDMK